jgi:hypothetical protein
MLRFFLGDTLLTIRSGAKCKGVMAYTSRLMRDWSRSAVDFPVRTRSESLPDDLALGETDSRKHFRLADSVSKGGRI